MGLPEIVKISSKFTEPVIFKKIGNGWRFFHSDLGLSYGPEIQPEDLKKSISNLTIHPDTLYKISVDIKKSKIEKDAPQEANINTFEFDTSLGDLSLISKMLGAYGVDPITALRFAISNRLFVSQNVTFLLKHVYVNFDIFFDKNGNPMEYAMWSGVQIRYNEPSLWIVKSESEYELLVSNNNYTKNGLWLSGEIDINELKTKTQVEYLRLPDGFNKKIRKWPIKTSFLTFGKGFRTGGFGIPSHTTGVKFTGNFEELSIVDREVYLDLNDFSILPKRFCIHISTKISYLILPDSGIYSLTVTKNLKNLKVLRLGMTSEGSYDDAYFPYNGIEKVTAAHVFPKSTKVEEFEITSNSMFEYSKFNDKLSLTFYKNLKILKLGNGFHFPSLDLSKMKVLAELVIGDDFFGRITYPESLQKLEMGKKYFGYSHSPLVYFGDQYHREIEETWKSQTDFEDAEFPNLMIITAKNPLFESIGLGMVNNKEMKELRYIEVDGKILLDRSKIRDLNKN